MWIMWFRVLILKLDLREWKEKAAVDLRNLKLHTEDAVDHSKCGTLIIGTSRKMIIAWVLSDHFLSWPTRLS